MKTISRTLLEFIQPLLRVIGGEPSRDSLEQALKIGVTVWNAVVLEQYGFEGKYLSQARKLVEAEALPVAVQVFDSLVEHKRQSFEADRRIILGYEVIEEDGRLGVNVEAGSADDLPRPNP